MNRILFILLAAALPARALIWTSYDPKRHERFLQGPGPGAKPNPDFLFAGSDLTGVGWQSGPDERAAAGERTVTLISPRHFIGADHWRAEGSVSFLGKDGKVRSFEIDGYEKIPGDEDIVVGRLKTPVPKEYGVSHYALYEAANYAGLKTAYFGQKATAGYGAVRLAVQRAGGRLLQMPIDKKDKDRVIGSSGDSGGPSFAISNGRLALVGHHANNNLDSIFAAHRSEIDKVLAKDGYSAGVIRPAAPLRTPIQPATYLQSGDQTYKVAGCPQDYVRVVENTKTGAGRCVKEDEATAGRLFRETRNSKNPFQRVQKCLPGEAPWPSAKPFGGAFVCRKGAPRPF
jgi:hypothetical protein